MHNGRRFIPLAAPFAAAVARRPRHANMRDPRGQRLPVTVELIGPAGAGKSTLCRLLEQRAGAADGRVRVRRHLPRIFYNAVRLTPAFLALHRPYRGVLSREMRRLLYLKTLHQTLGRDAPRDSRALIFDEGPVYALSQLLMWSPEAIHGPGFGGWWRAELAQWAATLDVIVRLDGPDPFLAERIRRRAKPHGYKHVTDARLYEFLRRSRETLGQVVAGLEATCQPRLLDFRTDREPPERIVGQVSAVIVEEWQARGGGLPGAVGLGPPLERSHAG